MLNYMICAAVVCVLFLGIVYLSLLLQQHMLEEASDEELKETKKHLLELQQGDNFVMNGQDVLLSLEMVNEERIIKSVLYERRKNGQQAAFRLFVFMRAAKIISRGERLEVRQKGRRSRGRRRQEKKAVKAPAVRKEDGEGRC